MKQNQGGKFVPLFPYNRHLIISKIFSGRKGTLQYYISHLEKEHLPVCPSEKVMYTNMMMYEMAKQKVTVSTHSYVEEYSYRRH